MRRYARNDYFGADMKTKILTLTLAALSLRMKALSKAIQMNGALCQKCALARP